MTLGIVFLSPAAAGIITDRKLSAARGRVKFDEVTKCGIVDYVDGRLAYTFSGLAKARRFEATEFIAHALCEAGKGGVASDEAMQRLADKLTARFKHIGESRIHARTSILFAGYTYTSGEPAGVLYLVSNYQSFDQGDLSESVPEFAVHKFASNPGMVEVRSVGSNKWTEEDVRAFGERLSNLGHIPMEAALVAGATIIENASKLDQSVGGSCTSVYTSPDRARFEIGKVYFPDQPTAVVPSPNYVLGVYGNVGAYKITGASTEPLAGSAMKAVPRTNRNRPCSCGSGERYKDCHGAPDHLSKMTEVKIEFVVEFLAEPEDGSDMTFVSLRDQTFELAMDDQLGDYLSKLDKKLVIEDAQVDGAEVGG